MKMKLKTAQFVGAPHLGSTYVGEQIIEEEVYQLKTSKGVQLYIELHDIYLSTQTIGFGQSFEEALTDAKASGWYF